MLTLDRRHAKTPSMAKKAPPKFLTFSLDKKLRECLEAHRAHLETERGTRVSISDAARDAIFKVRQLPFAGLDK
jgi:hypothetical protein